METTQAPTLVRGDLLRLEEATIPKRHHDVFIKLHMLGGSAVLFLVHGLEFSLVAEWIHFTLFGIILPTIKLKAYAFWGLMNSATKLALAMQSSFGVFRLRVGLRQQNRSPKPSTLTP